jgi:flavin-dependent dehydrogenase
MNDADVLVVGGGPAGAALAALAAGRGARVTLVERKAFPRDKLCGEFVAGAGCHVLARLGVLRSLEAAGACTIGAVRLTTRAGRAVDVPLGSADTALGVSRKLLDLTLVERARAAGADVVHGWEAIEPLGRGRGPASGAVVREVGRDETRVLSARVVVAADGRRSRFARLAGARGGDPARTHPRSRFALARHFTGAPERDAGRIELHLVRGGYAGLSAVENGRQNLCVLFRARDLRALGGSPDRVLADLVRANPAADRALAGARPDGRWRSVGPLRFGPRRAAGGGVLFVGDAAGTVDPFAGMGIAHALVSAELALPHVLAAAERGSLDRERAEAWSEAWSRRFVRPTRRLRRLGRLLERPAAAEAVLRALEAGGGLTGRIVAATQAP